MQKSSSHSIHKQAWSRQCDYVILILMMKKPKPTLVCFQDTECWAIRLRLSPMGLTANVVLTRVYQLFFLGLLSLICDCAGSYHTGPLLRFFPNLKYYHAYLHFTIPLLLLVLNLRQLYPSMLSVALWGLTFFLWHLHNEERNMSHQESVSTTLLPISFLHCSCSCLDP